MPGILKKIGSLYKRRLYKFGMKYGGFLIPVNYFGPGLSIAHGGTIVVNDTAKIGNYCRINEVVTIGATGNNGQAALIGNNRFIVTGANAVVTMSFIRGWNYTRGYLVKKSAIIYQEIFLLIRCLKNHKIGKSIK